MRRDHRITAAAVAGLVLGMLVLLAALGAEGRGEIAWSTARWAVYAPVLCAFALGVAASR